MSTKSNFNESEAQKFVTENIALVPKNQMKKFEAMSLEQKAAKIQFYIDIKKLREDARIKNSIPNKVKELFDKRGTVEDAKDVMRFCQEFIDGFKQREVAKIDEQIRQLELMKAQIA